MAAVLPLRRSEVKVLDLWNGSSNATPPAGYQTVAFDDSAWAAPVIPGEFSFPSNDMLRFVLSTPSPVGVLVTPAVAIGSQKVWPTTAAADSTQRVVLRWHFNPGAGPFTNAELLLLGAENGASVTLSLNYDGTHGLGSMGYNQGGNQLSNTQNVGTETWANQLVANADNVLVALIDPGTSAWFLSVAWFTMGWQFPDAAEVPHPVTWAWGFNATYGELGVGDVAEHNRPTPVATSVDFSAADLGTGLGADSQVYWFGQRFDAVSWDGVNDSSPHPFPIVVSGLLNIVKLTCGTDFRMALDSGGNLWGNAQPDQGWLGIGNGPGGSTDVNTPSLLATGVLDVAAGSDHAIILKSGGVVQGTGSQFFGAGDSTTRTVWTTVTPAGPATVTGIRAGFEKSYCLMSDGTVRGTGVSSSGQLGVINTVNNSWLTLPFTGVVDLNTIFDPFSNQGTTYALLNDGTIWSIGANDGVGNLGTGDASIPTNTITPMQLVMPVGVTAVSLARPGYAPSCGAFLGSDGQIYTWGRGTNGQMGNGTTTAANPTPIAGTGISSATWVEINSVTAFSDGIVGAIRARRGRPSAQVIG